MTWEYIYIYNYNYNLKRECELWYRETLKRREQNVHMICACSIEYKTLEMFLAPKQSTATDKSRHGGGIGFQITWPNFAHINVRHACTAQRGLVRPRGHGRLGPECAPFEVSGSRSRIASDQASDPQIDAARSRAAVAVAARGCAIHAPVQPGPGSMN